MGGDLIMNKKGQTGMIAALIGIMIAVIIGVGVTIPVVNQVIANASLSGTTALIVTYIPLLIAVVLLVAVAALIAMGRR